MKIMISQPMRGKTNEQIKKERENIVNKLMSLGYEVFDTVFDFPDLKATHELVYYLAKSIEVMSVADAMLFMDGWENARGCKIEHEIAKEYGIKILYEDFIN